ncbi:putative nucleotidyltransferase substrate binding domain-containing protein [Corynebacterium sp. A21]|uniref:putative nucleotidyltransferase substrate binding domain-containing protein n=1 Tax=Corynebacterium sp. A21 TaxID=3457318 RepID=UPI003FD0DD4F
MLHQSLLDLAEQAPQCEQVATVRGVLAESHELLRNALAHDAPVIELSRWYSTLVSDALHSPAIVELSGGNQVILTGAIGRGDALPTSKVEWLLLTDSAGDSGAEINSEISKILNSVGLHPAPLTGSFSPTDRSTWENRIEQAAATGDPAGIEVFADAGSWLREHLLRHLGTVLPLLHGAIEHRPPTLRSENGLPDRDAVVDIRRELLAPVTTIARWAGLSTRTHCLATQEYLHAALAADILNDDEADLLQQGWVTGLDLQFHRWMDHVENREVTVADLPALQRSAFGAASRGIAWVIRSLAARHDIDLPGNGA